MSLPPEGGDFRRNLSPVHLSPTRGLRRISRLGNAIALGFNADAIVITGNQFLSSFDHVLVVNLNASTVFNGTFNSATDRHDFSFSNNADFTLFPAQMHGSQTGNPMFFLESGSTGSSGTTMNFATETNLLTTPSFSSLR